MAFFQFTGTHQKSRAKTKKYVLRCWSLKHFRVLGPLPSFWQYARVVPSRATAQQGHAGTHRDTRVNVEIVTKLPIGKFGHLGVYTVLGLLSVVVAR